MNENILNLDSNGEHVVLARFPEEGKTLAVFGLNTSALKSIAIPNDLREWTVQALTGCLNLESITTFGEELETPLFQVVQAHFEDCPNLKHLHIPSSIEIGNATFQSSNLQSVVFPASTRTIGYRAFYSCTQLTSVDLSKCGQLNLIGTYLFDYCVSMTFMDLSGCKNLINLTNTSVANCAHLRSADLSGCTKLKNLEMRVFASDSALVSVALPSGLTKIGPNVFCFYGGSFPLLPKFRFIIWRGCSQRPSGLAVDPQAFGHQQTLDDLVNAGIIQEIFVP